MTLPELRASYVEQQHPRGPGGKWAAKGSSDSSGGTVPPAVAAQIRDFQKRTGLKVTGQFDAATMAHIHKLTAPTAGGGKGGSAAKKAAAALKKQQAAVTRAQKHAAQVQRARSVALAQAVNKLPTAQRALYRQRTKGVAPPGYQWTPQHKLVAVPQPTAASVSAQTQVAQVLAPAGARYDVTPLGLKKNWVTDVGGLPLFMRAIAHALIRNGHSESSAIATAVAACKRWAAGGGHVTAKTRAKAAAAVAEWEAKKAAAHAVPNKRDAVTEGSTFGALLPKGPYVHLPQGRGKCTICGHPVKAVHHMAAIKARRKRLEATRHAGPGHMPVPGGHVKTAAHHVQAQSRLVDAHATLIEDQARKAMGRLFAAQEKAVVSRLNGQRGRKTVRAAQPEQPEEPAPPVDPSGVFDAAYWTAQTQQALEGVFDTAHVLTTARMSDGLHPGQDLPDAADAVARVLAERASSVAADITRTTYQDIADTLAQGLQQGENMQQLTDRVRHVFQVASDSRAETIARTESIGAINQAGQAYAQALPSGIVAYKKWVATEDSRTRPAHRLADGQQRNVDMPFTVGGVLMMQPGDPAGGPENVINCFPADTSLEAPGVLAGSRRAYVGEMVRVRTRSGATIRATPNHPVLTARGWVALKSLDKGDHLIKATLFENSTVRRPEVDDVPATIGEVVDSLLIAADAARMVARPQDFHGDLSDGYVDVVGTDRLLWTRNESVIRKSLNRLGLSETDLPDTALHIGGSRSAPRRDAFRPFRSVTPSGVRGLSQSSALGQRGLSHAGVHGSGAVATLDSGFREATLDDITRDAEADCYGLFALARDVATDEIVEVEIESVVRCHVYNIQTLTGWYVSNGIVAHNCRCRPVYVPRRLTAVPAA